MYQIINKTVMRKNILKVLVSILLLPAIFGCGSKFLDTDYSRGIDFEEGLSSVENIDIALNGVYYRLFYYYFAGNYATNIGDIPTDITYFNGKTGHWDKLYYYTFTETDTYLSNIWSYGYKVVDHSARIIQGAKELYPSVSATEKKVLDRCMAEAYALRAYAMLGMVNVYGHQIKVNGTDFSSRPGLVLVNEPIPEFEQVSRATVGETYAAILSDLNNSLSHFAVGETQSTKTYFTPAAVKGLLARTYLYMENWSEAASYAKAAILESGLKMTYDAGDYSRLYSGGGGANTESIFYLAIDDKNNWSANSCGTLWTSYNMSPSPKLQALYGANDIRTSIMGMAKSSTASVPVYGGGKFRTKNPALATNYLINLPEMYLIAAEAYCQQDNISEAAIWLVNVAKRNLDITSPSDLPTAKNEMLQFIKDERARELFQEGLRLWDLRRWDEMASVNAYNAPSINYRYNNYKISDLIYPIPADEINAGFGVTQNDWSNTLPK